MERPSDELVTAVQVCLGGWDDANRLRIRIRMPLFSVYVRSAVAGGRSLLGKLIVFAISLYPPALSTLPNLSQTFPSIKVRKHSSLGTAHQVLRCLFRSSTSIAT